MRVVGVLKGLPREMAISAIRPEECIPMVVRRKQIGSQLARGMMAGETGDVKQDRGALPCAVLPPYPLQPTGLWGPVLSPSHLPCSLRQLLH
jgi:hypothetical protein